MLNKYKPYTCRGEFNGGSLLLDYVNSFSTGPLDSASGINISERAYCELYY
jgi:hypothetical protein